MARYLKLATEAVLEPTFTVPIYHNGGPLCSLTPGQDPPYFFPFVVFTKGSTSLFNLFRESDGLSVKRGRDVDQVDFYLS